MNKTTKIMALLPVLATMAVSCQKENVTDHVPGTSISEASAVYTVQYAVDF